MTDSLSISALARELSVTTRTIRFYEEQGLIDPERRGQERVYSPADRALLVLILHAKSLGFSLNECHTLVALTQQSQQHLDKAGLIHRLEEITSLRERLDERRTAIEHLLETLDTAEDEVQQRLDRTNRPRRDNTDPEHQLNLGFFDGNDGGAA